MKNIAILDSNEGSEDKNRFLQLSEKLNCEIIYYNEFLKQESSINKLLISDSFDSKSFFHILNKIKIIKPDKLYFLNLEMYSIDNYALISDHSIRNIYPNIKNLNFIKLLKTSFYLLIRIIKIFIIKKIIFENNTSVIIPSKLRLEKFKAKKDIKKVLLKNFPTRKVFGEKNYTNYINNINLENIRYFYLAGNINNYEEFNKVCKFSKSKNIKVIVSTNNYIPKHCLVCFKDTLILTGTLETNEVIALMKNSIACVALYHPKISNLKYCASSKLFEYMALNKHIVASKVDGIVHEINFYRYKKIDYINNLETLDVTKLKVDNNELINENFFYESQLRDVVL